MNPEDIRIRDQGQTGADVGIAAAMVLEMAMAHQSKPDPFLYASLSLMSTHPRTKAELAHVRIEVRATPVYEVRTTPVYIEHVQMTDKETTALERVISRYCQQMRDRRSREGRQGENKEATS
jgi:hypothetical protein